MLWTELEVSPALDPVLDDIEFRNAEECGDPNEAEESIYTTVVVVAAGLDPSVVGPSTTTHCHVLARAAEPSWKQALKTAVVYDTFEGSMLAHIFMGEMSV